MNEMVQIIFSSSLLVVDQKIIGFFIHRNQKSVLNSSCSLDVLLYPHFAGVTFLCHLQNLSAKHLPQSVFPSGLYLELGHYDRAPPSDLLKLLISVNLTFRYSFNSFRYINCAMQYHIGPITLLLDSVHNFTLHKDLYLNAIQQFFQLETAHSSC